MTAIKHTFLLFVCLFVTGTTIDTGCCEKTSTASCKFFLICLGHAVSIIIWSTTHAKSLGCPIGSMGKDCSIVCPYPFFGPNCKSHCDCEENICHEVKGISAPHEQSTQEGYITSDGQFSSKTLIITISTALGTCIFIIVLLVVLLSQRMNRVPNVQTHIGDFSQN
ncbi:uncharacterized protein LOC111099142 isoform X2 [Crassostrea virginica]